MRVLMTTDTIGGVWSHSLQLCRSFERHGVDIVLATMGAPATAAQMADARALRNVSLRTSAWRLEWMEDPWRDVAAAGEWLLRLADAERPDVVHLNGFAHGALPWKVPVLTAGHSCVTSWWRAVNGEDPPREWLRYRTTVAAGLRAADLVVAPTRAMLGALHEHYGPFRDSVVIPNGCDGGGLPLGLRDAFGRYVRRPAAEPLVLAAGRVWDDAKNLRILGDVAADVAWPVFGAGADAGPDGVRRQLAGVHHLGQLTPAALHHWYRRAAIFVHPALYEPFGLAPLEAALQHCALVLADIPSLREVWGDAAIFADPRDAGAIAAAINRLSADPVLLVARADAAYRRALTFTAQRMARGYHAAYQQICTVRPRTDTMPEALTCAS
jgi:glycogen synthase